MDEGRAAVLSGFMVMSTAGLAVCVDLVLKKGSWKTAGATAVARACGARAVFAGPVFRFWMMCVGGRSRQAALIFVTPIIVVAFLDGLRFDRCCTL